ncbi:MULTISPECIES: hypothetical protein [unclassified Ensifer]|uniref:hypothetical protein n=1 Tax=unclassified Ensifer TaxID=2633371 RepID=UPI0008134348|nr:MULTISPECIES: hypothetical protein [unclassified Ensifer]OCP17426.1 hypothetical protein BC361_08185 [Ensifer sp. LC54]OCP28668.1 hypothetical protein BC363_02170 [Ensifer sp. LC384]
MKAKIETPIDLKDLSKVEIEEIPLPPQEMWGELNNTESSTSAPSVTVEEFASSAGPVASEAILDFVGSNHIRTVQLAHKFRFNGELVETVTIKRLTIGQVSTFIQEHADKPFTTFDVYAVMTGLSASVLRGLIDEDGDLVTDAAYSFLPLALRPDAEPAAT